MSLSHYDTTNFKTLSRAIRQRHAVLVECQLVSTGMPVPVICAANPHDDGSRTLIPFGLLFNDDPFTVINPPPPHREDFATQDDVWLASLL